MIKEELIDKIKKLLALADSSNPNEAAVALSRAQKLMERYNIEAVDLKIENVARMICHAHSLDYDKIGVTEQTRMQMWAESICMYLQN